MYRAKEFLKVAKNEAPLVLFKMTMEAASIKKNMQLRAVEGTGEVWTVNKSNHNDSITLVVEICRFASTIDRYIADIVESYDRENRLGPPDPEWKEAEKLFNEIKSTALRLIDEVKV